MAARTRKMQPAVSAGLRTVGIRVGAAAVAAALGVALYLHHERAPAPATEVDRRSIVWAPPPPVTPPSPVIEAPAPPRRDASLESVKPMPATLRTAFDAWLMASYAKCWKAPKTLPDGDPYLAKVRVTLTEDGGLAVAPRLVNPPADPAWKAHAEAALKAVKGCDPLHVPDKYAEYYPSWKSKTVYFDPTRN